MHRRYFHWYNASNGTRLKLQNSVRKCLIEDAISRFNGQASLSRETGLCTTTIFNYMRGTSMTVGGLKKILDALERVYDSVEDDIIELSWCKSVKLPIDLSSPAVAIIAAAILGDGTHTTRVEYKNSDAELIKKVEHAVKDVFKSAKVNHRISDQNIPYIVLPDIIKQLALHLGIKQGKQVFINPRAPKQVRKGGKEVQKAFIQHFFDDEGSVERNYRRVSVSQAVACTEKIPKTFGSKMEVRRPYYIKDLPKGTKNRLAAPRILIDIKAMLKNTFDIDSKLQFKRSKKQRSGHISAFWELVLYKHESVRKFKDSIGFHCSRKQEALEFTLNQEYTLPPNSYCALINKALEVSRDKNSFTAIDLANGLGYLPRPVKKRMITLVHRGIFSRVKKGEFVVNIKIGG